MKRKRIWSYDIGPIEDWIDENGKQMSYEEADELNDIYLEDERLNLDVTTNGEIICIADVGLWDGRRKGYKLMGHKVSNILYPNDGYCTWEYDSKNIYGIESHHDGTNCYLYRELKGNTHDECVANAEKLFSKPITNRRLGYYTKPMAHYVKEVYGC